MGRNDNKSITRLQCTACGNALKDWILGIQSNNNWRCNRCGAGKYRTYRIQDARHMWNPPKTIMEYVRGERI